jgi:hypothetical protein
MKLEESMAGEDSEPETMCSDLAGTHFTNRKQCVQNWQEHILRLEK